MDSIRIKGESIKLSPVFKEDDGMMSITQKEFKMLSDYIRENYGIYMKEEKKSILTGRLKNVLIKSGITNFTDYYKHIVSDKTGNAATTLVDQITTNHTFFMRESNHFFYLRDNVLPYFSKTIKDRDLRIWCAACSTGEEAYTIAMIIDEFFGTEKRLWDTKILATDISSRVLNISKAGKYADYLIKPLPSLWKINYFKKSDESNYTVNDKIKNEVIFRSFNLMNNTFPFKKKFHVIFCRNVMIYFDNQTRNDLINKFYDCLEDGGYLFVGHSESVDREKSKFKFVKPAVYRK